MHKCLMLRPDHSAVEAFLAVTDLRMVDACNQIWPETCVSNSQKSRLAILEGAGYLVIAGMTRTGGDAYG